MVLDTCFSRDAALRARSLESDTKARAYGSGKFCKRPRRRNGATSFQASNVALRRLHALSNLFLRQAGATTRLCHDFRQRVLNVG